ncbi:hypothetical protein PaeBR_02590 [Paenibacillus sp. BR2-3]|uniref:hypothetical protein n=1 Tax=Paenibacillus sp. BR2-3 TaxID=3048494 RepID=UPI0039779B80
MDGNQKHVAKEGKLTTNRPFVLLITAQLISNVGDWLHLLALLTMVGLAAAKSQEAIAEVSYI